MGYEARVGVNRSAPRVQVGKESTWKAQLLTGKIHVILKWNLNEMGRRGLN